MSEIENLQAAGFTPDEIGAWAAERRNTLSSAGFKDNEIDAYFAGGVTVPDAVPPSVVRRVQSGTEVANSLQTMRKVLGGNVTDRIGSALMEGGAAGFGDSPVGLPAEDAKKLQDLGVFAKPGEPYNLVSGVRFMNEAMIRPGYAAVETLFRGVNAAIFGVGAAGGQVAAEVTGGNEAEQARARRDGAQMAFVSTMLTTGQPLTRTKRGPTGEMHTEVIGTLPKTDDFVAAARTIGDDANMVRQEKLLDMYEKQGVHPAEVAADAAADPVLKQRILSSERLDVPEGYAPPRAPEAPTGPMPDPGPFPDVWKINDDAKYNAAVTEWKRLDRERAEWQKQYSAYEKTLPAFENTRGRGQQYHGSPRSDVAPDATHYGSMNIYGNGFYTTDAADIAHGYSKRKGREGEGSFYTVTPKEEIKTLNMEQAVPEWLVSGLDERFPIDAYVKAVADGEFGPKPKNVRELYDEIRAGSREEGFTADDLQELFQTFKERIEDAGFGAMEHTGGLRTNNSAHRVIIYFDPSKLDIVKTDRNGLRTKVAAPTNQPPSEPPPPPPKPPAAPEPPPPGSFEEAQGKILDKISVGDRDSRPMSWSKLYTQTVDDLHPIKAVSEDAYQAARLVRGQFGKADTFINNGTFDFNTYKTTGKPLKDVLAPVRDDLDGFRAYLASKRAVEVEATGRTSGFDLAAAQEVIAKGDGKYATAAAELVDYQNSVLKYLKDSGVLSERAYGAMVEAGQSYIPFYRVFGEEAGGGAGRSLGPGNPVKKLKGSERDIIDPLESVIKNTYAYISVAERNAAGVKIVEALEAQGLKAKAAPKVGAEADLVDYLKQNGVRDPEALIDFVKQSADDGTAISAWKDGKKISVEVNDPDLVAAFRGLDQQSAALLTKVFAVPASTLRAGAVLSPDFMARNLIRDFMTAFVNSKGLFSPIDTLKGFKSAVAKDDVYWNWKKAGGDNATMVALDRRYLQESITDLTAKTGLGTRSWNVVTNPLAGLRMVSELTEQATRLGEFRKVLKGMETKEMMQTAAYASREVTLDFSRVGASMRAYNMITAFANAQIQGMDRIVRAGIDRPLNTAVKIAGGVTMPSVLLWAANHGDPRYEELPDWQKDLFWIVLTDKWEPISATDAQGKPEHLLRQEGGQWQVNNGHIWRIPKPFEVGVLFGSGVERTLSATIGKDKEAFDGFTKSVANMLTPSVVPTAAVPIFEQWANRSSFTDRTLIPASAEKLLPEYQYTPYTTETTKALGRLVASFPGLREASVEEGNVAGPVARAASSPILIENYLRAWTGGLGMYALNIVDVSLRKSGVLPDPVTPTPTLADIPFVKAFAVRYPSASADSIQKFYDEYGRDKRYFDTWQAKAKEGDAEAMAKVQAAGGPGMFLRLDEIRRALTEHSTLIRDVYKAPDIPRDEKRQLIDGLYYAMIELGRAGRGAMKEGRAALDAPAE